MNYEFQDCNVNVNGKIIFIKKYAVQSIMDKMKDTEDVFNDHFQRTGNFGESFGKVLNYLLNDIYNGSIVNFLLEMKKELDLNFKYQEEDYFNVNNDSVYSGKDNTRTGRFSNKNKEESRKIYEESDFDIEVEDY